MKNIEKAINILEFDKIKTMLSECCSTEGAKAIAMSLLPSSDNETVLKRQNYTQIAKSLVGIKGAPSFNSIPDITDIVGKAEKSSLLSLRELLDVASVLQTSNSLKEYIKTDYKEENILTEIFDRLVSDKAFEKKIRKVVLNDEMIADEASPLLFELRRKIRKQTNKIRETLQGYLSGEKAKHLRDTVVTIRNGRYVLPVKAESKSEVKGLIHDTSGSGSTLFIEPMNVVEANNELRTLFGKEQDEIDRILSELSQEVSDRSIQLITDYRCISEIAFYFACAELSYKMNAVEPIINTEREVKYLKARHPLLNQSKVVPIDINIGEKYSMIVITGPNTGGKTVSLKTIGLFSLMVQSGLQIPADNASVCIFDGVYPDIGDEQSIEQSLSTFSSHISNIIHILNDYTPESLVLFDELGAGTDPVEGAALAQSILENVLSMKCICCATTHYAELKAFALNTDGVMNASCEFNTETLKPTYRLIIGTPGKSNAFLISSKLGISNEIIDRAKTLISSESKNFEDVIEKLDETRFSLEKKNRELEKEKREFEAFKTSAEKELKSKLENAENTSKAMMQKAQQMITGAKASAEFVFQRLDKLQKEKDSDNFSGIYNQEKKQLRSKMLSDDDIYNPVEKEEDSDYVLPRELVKGDKVILRNLGSMGVLSDDPDVNGNVSVKVGVATIKTNLLNLKLCAEDSIIKSVADNQKSKTFSSRISGSFSVNLDVRGKNVEDAWIDIDKYIDEAILYSIQQVTIIHGKGTGALRKGLWDLFRKDSRIKKFKSGEYGEGDYGVTVITLK